MRSSLLHEPVGHWRHKLHVVATLRGSENSAQSTYRILVCFNFAANFSREIGGDPRAVGYFDPELLGDFFRELDSSATYIVSDCEREISGLNHGRSDVCSAARVPGGRVC